MHTFSKSTYLALAASWPLTAGTVVITSVPDEQHPLAPLTSFGGIPLAAGGELRVGAFPRMSDGDILDDAAKGGLAVLTAAFVPFGAPFAIGDGVDGTDGAFEIAVKESSGNPQAAWVGEEISLLIQAQEGQEFLIARFGGKRFETDSDTGLESWVSLHLADAEIIVGNRYSGSRFATSSAPVVGTFETWIAGFLNITDPELRRPDADADEDGRSNFLEYTTGGNPESPGDPLPCQVVQDDGGAFWIRFSRAAGLGSVRYTVESSHNFISEWKALPGTVEPDPEPPVAGTGDWMRVRLPTPLDTTGFFRLQAAPIPDGR